MTVEEIIQFALDEDVHDPNAIFLSGDHTSKACIEEDQISKGKMIAKEDGVIAGIEIAEQLFHAVDSEIKISPSKKDGDKVKKGDQVLEVLGNAQSILRAERVALNLMQRMSGIATMTSKYVEAISGTKAKVLDTRKTTPCLRRIEKMAVEMGGGSNHRMGLYDMIMIKDNHIDYAGGIKNAIERTRQYLEEIGEQIPVEIEVRNFEELKEVLSIGKITRIMLDNFTVADTEEAVKIIDGQFEVESSGGITIETIRGYAEAGVDFISSGALTHSVKSLDISLEAIPIEKVG